MLLLKLPILCTVESLLTDKIVKIHCLVPEGGWKLTSSYVTKLQDLIMDYFACIVRTIGIITCEIGVLSPWQG